MLARRTHHQRQLQPRQLVQPRQDLRILLFAFAETRARIDHDAAPLDTSAHRAMHRRIQLSRDRRQRILERRQLGPRLRHAAHMIDDQPGVGLPRRARQFRIDGQPAGVVDDIRAQLQRFFRDPGFISVHANRDGQLVAQPLQAPAPAAAIPRLRRCARNPAAWIPRRYR